MAACDFGAIAYKIDEKLEAFTMFRLFSVVLAIFIIPAAPVSTMSQSAQAGTVTYEFEGIVTGMLEFTPTSTGPFLPGPIVFEGTSIAIDDLITGFFTYDTAIGGLPARDTSGLTGFVATINGITSVSNQDVGVRFRNNQFGQDDFNFRSGFRNVRNVNLIDTQESAISGSDLLQPLTLSDFLDSGDTRTLQVILGTAFDINGQITSLSGPVITSTPPTLPAMGPGVFYVPGDSSGGGGGSNPIPEPTSIALFGIGAIGLIAFHRRKRKQAA